MAQPDPFGQTLRTIQSAQFSARSIPVAGHELGDVERCPECGEEVVLSQTPNAYKGLHIRYWSECSCWRASIARAKQIGAAGVAAQLGSRDPDILEDAGLRAADLRRFADMTLDRFDASRLQGGPTNPYTAALQWFRAIEGAPVADYHRGPPAALYLYSKGKGRGKTHLGVGLLHKANGAGRTVAFLNEAEYIESYWAASFEAREQLSSYPASRAWLTLLDDLGQKESRGSGLRDAWYDILGPRWLERKWLIVTSNYTPDELLAQGTINEASYSRLVQMTRGQLLTFQASDYRLAAA